MGSGASSVRGERGVSASTSSGSMGGKQSPVANYHKSQAPPAPFPPPCRKGEIFTDVDYKSVDDHVINLPPDMNYGTFKDLVAYLTEDENWTDLARVRAIFRWVTSVDVFSVQVDRKPPKHSPMEYFIKIQNNMGNHAHLMAGLCQMAGIPCVILSGMNKSAAYEIGKKADRQSMGAQWNAVYVSDSWRFIDAFWASACVVGKRSGEWTLVDADGDVEEEDASEVTEGETQHRINEFYFLPDPDQFVWTHFPDDAKWQLLAKPVTIQQFEGHYYVRERFHILGMSSVESTKLNCVADTKDGEVEFTFGLPPDRSPNYRFKYMLYRSKATASESRVDVFLDRFVLFEQRDNMLRFALRFPIKGSFKLDIYGLDVDEGDVFDLCCTYIINCPQGKSNCLPLPDCPPVGWGPVPETAMAGLKPVSHNQAEVSSRDGYVEIRLAKDRALAFHQLLKHSVIDEATLSKYSVTELDDKEAVVYLRLPQKGEYALKLFAQGLEDEGAAPNVLNYLINCSNTDQGSKPFPNVTNGLLGCNPVASSLFGVQAISHKDRGMIDAKDGKLSVQFKANPDVELVCEMHTNDGRAATRMAKQVKNADGTWTFDLDMPVKGEYSLNVFARNKNDENQIHSVHTYLIKSSGRDEDGAVTPGVEDEARDTSVPTETVETSDGEVMIPVPPDCESVVAAVHRRNGQDPPDPKQVEFFTADDMNLVNVKLRDYGEYMLNLYNLDKQGKLVENVAKYQINRKRPGELYRNNLATIMEDMKPSRQSTIMEKKGGSEEDRKRQAKRNVQNAMDLKDVRTLEEAIKKCLAAGVSEDDALLTKAKQQLAIFKAKADLMEASQKRDMAELEKAIAHARSVNSNHELDLQIALATRLRDHLQKIDKLRHSVLNMEPKTISEIKSYAKPPDGVHQCMIATFLLLGHQLKELKDWQKVQALLGKTGKESVMRKISLFEAQTVPLRSAQVAKRTLKPYDKDQIRDVSAGAATFYIWALGMVEEVESYGGAEEADQMRLKK
ncbi:kyphoscoliosis peptidase [Plakobranchus ocellatus]|uniref:Kyphoscoliosis peptidase n=1 Tax=Plakobranchus ocellatus TaxID=259542 RepID=A0AAV3ZK71_9GAST|nr:kyphoscoliosis peptidase [Plakobranchus ocellatus]